MLEEVYTNEVVGKLIQEIGYKNVMQVPKVLKVCVNVGVSQKFASRSVDAIMDDLKLIVGQKPVVTYAKKSISGFSLRKGDIIGCKVTLRKTQMYGFLERLLYIALPRERDFRGFNMTQFDGNGNLSFGIKEHVVFPEIDYDTINSIFGMDVSVVTNAINDGDAKLLLYYLGFPFIK